MARLLVIDDNDLNRTVLERRLVRRGHEVLSASSTVEGLTLAASGPLDIAVRAFQAVGSARQQRDMPPVPAELDCGGAADATGGAGDDCDFSFHSKSSMQK